jgi:uncharacterized protein (DUF427 family)
MKIPGPDHPITITPNPKRVKILVAGKVIAETTSALALQEASYPVVQYIPRKDADMSLLKRTAHSTHCPYKGDASYFSIESEGGTLANAVWSYQEPFPPMAEIKDYLAFYPNKVTIEEVAL